MCRAHLLRTGQHLRARCRCIASHVAPRIQQLPAQLAVGQRVTQPCLRAVVACAAGLHAPAAARLAQTHACKSAHLDGAVEHALHTLQQSAVGAKAFGKCAKHLRGGTWVTPNVQGKPD